VVPDIAHSNRRHLFGAASRCGLSRTQVDHSRVLNLDHRSATPAAATCPWKPFFENTGFLKDRQ